MKAQSIAPVIVLIVVLSTLTVAEEAKINVIDLYNDPYDQGPIYIDLPDGSKWIIIYGRDYGPWYPSLGPAKIEKVEETVCVPYANGEQLCVTIRTVIEVKKEKCVVIGVGTCYSDGTCVWKEFPYTVYLSIEIIHRYPPSKQSKVNKVNKQLGRNPRDFNGDGRVDIYDQVAIREGDKKRRQAAIERDLNKDGRVDIYDLVLKADQDKAKPAPPRPRPQSVTSTWGKIKGGR